MTLISKPSTFWQKTGDANTAVSITLVTDGLTGATVICESISGSFNNQLYTIEVSDHDGDYIILRSTSLGTGNLQSNSFTIDNASVFGNPLHFRYNRYSIPALGGVVKGKITFSGR